MKFINPKNLNLLPDDLLLCLKDNLKQTDNVNLSILNKNFNIIYGDCSFLTYKINRNFTMKDLRLMILLVS